MNSISFNLFPRLLTVGSVHLLEDSMYFFMQILRRMGFLKIFHFISSFFLGRSPLAVTICSSKNVPKKKEGKTFLSNPPMEIYHDFLEIIINPTSFLPFSLKEVSSNSNHFSRSVDLPAKLIPTF